jgi:predicted N-formylglutamate amidohydrolase
MRRRADDDVLGNRSLDRFDVCIIGSGAGGGTAAHVLTAGGLNVLVLEAGHNPYPDLDDPKRLPAPVHGSDEVKYDRRLVVDCNRHLLDPGAFLVFGDGVLITGNRNLSAESKAARAESVYWPYHKAIDGEVRRLRLQARLPILLSIHSFTPVLDGVARPWQVGILWDKDRHTAELLIKAFAAAGYHVGDNEPYSGKAPQEFTLDHHAESAGLPHAGIEIRQDLIDTAEGVDRMVSVMRSIVEMLPSRIYSSDIETGKLKRPA